MSDIPRPHVALRTVWLAAASVSLVLCAAVGMAQAAGPSPKPDANAYVSPSGSDVGSCPKTAPCKTINYAITQAPSGGTVLVEPGTYHQTVAITKPVSVLGSGADKTTIDGAGIDPSASSVYGVVYVGPAGGSVTVSKFTITNPYPFSYTGGEPEAVALADPNSGDQVTITDNTITEGTADSGSGTDFPIGIDTFKNYASTTITDNAISGFFQGALLEDNGPATVSDNSFRQLIANSSGGTTYPAEGLFFLSDLAGSITGQNATDNSFTDYAGYGIAASAGYNNGNCSTTPCNGSLSGALTSNSFDLQGASGAAAISLSSQFSGNNLTMDLRDNRGAVTSPDDSIDVVATNGGTTSISEQSNNIRVRQSGSGSSGTGGRTAFAPAARRRH